MKYKCWFGVCLAKRDILNKYKSQNCIFFEIENKIIQVTAFLLEWDTTNWPLWKDITDPDLIS